jgi:homogentisate 1,2-dioxygenase
VRNGDGHELWFVQEGRGLLACEYGVLAFRPGHYLVIPKGTTYRVELESEECHLLMIESRFPFRFGPEHLTLTGQAALTAPIVETETDIPEFRPPRDEEGEFRVWTKHGGGFVTEIFLGHHPFDLIGWEGALFPYTVHVDDLHLLSRRVRVSPIAHRTFASGLSADSEIFIGTIKDQIGGWHEQAIAVDYARHNVDCDEVLFHANTNGFGMEYVEPASLTLHPGALAQSPRGLAAKYSLAERGKPSDGLSIALHTMFQPLSVAKQAFSVADKDYATSWNLDAQGSQPKG